MSSTKRYLLIALCFALALTIFAVLAPRTVHAITATLVQIVNTPTNAVPAMHAPPAAQLRQFACSGTSNGYANAYCAFPAVPANQTLIVETVTMLMYTEPGNAPAQPYFSAAGDGLWDKPGNYFAQMNAQPGNLWAATLTGRVPVLASAAPGCVVYFQQNSKYGSITCQLSGYLVPAQ